MSLSIRLFGNRDRAQELVGKAKKQMVALKHFMGFGNLSQLEPQPIRMSDGSTIRVRSVFGIDIIDIIGAGVVSVKVGELIPANFLFLIYSSTEYAVWRIIDNGDDGIKPEPTNFLISSVTKPFDMGSYMNPSVVKSNKDYDKHFYTIENHRVDAHCFYWFYPYYSSWQYGRNLECESAEVTVVIGFSNCWIDGAFDSNTDYLSHPSGNGSDFIASGRNSAYTDEDGVQIKNLRLMYIDNVSGQIKYEEKDEEGKWLEKDGNIVSFRQDKPYDIHAVLSPTKFFGVDSNSYEFISNSIPRPCTFYIGLVGGGSEFYEKYDVVFGNVIIEQNKVGSWHNIMGSNDACPGICVYQEWVDGSEDAKVFPADYCNINVDETFLIFYRKRIDGGIHVWGSRVKDGRCQATYDFYDRRNGYTYQWKIAYRLKGGDVQYITNDANVNIICSYASGRLFHGYPSEVLFDGYGGQRIDTISCYASEKYLFYSYSLWTYNGPDNENHFEDFNNDYFTFEKRVLGIINIETGVKSEHTVNDELLGDMYKDTFDKTKAAAIGWHKEGG